MSTSSPRYFYYYAWLAAFEGAACAVYLLSIPPDPKNSLILGYSAARLALVFATLAFSTLFAGLALRARRHPNAPPADLSWLNRGELLVLALLLALAGLASLWVKPAQLRDAQYLFIRFQPLVFLAALLGLQTLLLAAAAPQRPLNQAVNRTRQRLAQLAGSLNQSFTLPTPAARWAMGIFLAVYLVLGIYTQLQLIVEKPLPRELIADFKIYARALEEVQQGLDPYANRAIGSGFFYPLPSLLLIEPFALISDFNLRAAAFTAFNILLVCLMLWGIAHRFHLPLQAVWWWYPLALGFAPFYELLHIGQINMITQFGVTMMFLWEPVRPAWSGAWLCIGFVSKFTPAAYLGYLLARMNWKALLGFAASAALLFIISGLRFGWQPILQYPAVLLALTNDFHLSTNAQSLVAKLSYYHLLTDETVPLASRALNGYIALVFAASGLLALTRRTPPVQETFFIILCLGTLLAPSVMWYHHYVFFFLPLFLWMAAARLRRAVVWWCFLGMTLIQIDRFALTYGLTAHIFGHLSILALLVRQVSAARQART